MEDVFKIRSGRVITIRDQEGNPHDCMIQMGVIPGVLKSQTVESLYDAAEALIGDMTEEYEKERKLDPSVMLVTPIGSVYLQFYGDRIATAESIYQVAGTFARTLKAYAALFTMTTTCVQTPVGAKPPETPEEAKEMAKTNGYEAVSLMCKGPTFEPFMFQRVFHEHKGKLIWAGETQKLGKAFAVNPQETDVMEFTSIPDWWL